MKQKYHAKIEPRGLSREEAADYIGVSPVTFDKMVADGRMPQPKVINSRIVWDRWELDAAFTAIPNRNQDTSPADEWAVAV
jgi:excisionase family DNA binding protein